MSLNDSVILSGRGPGMIGMVLAMVVLAGFVLLYLFVFDEGMQGADQSLESIIAQQDREIDSLTQVIAHHHHELAKTAALTATGKQLTDVMRAAQLRAARRDKLVRDIDAATTELAATTAKLAAYQQQYVNFIRNRARDRQIPRLLTRKGKSYDNAVIRNVTDLGVEIRHDGGSARISPADLPDDLRDEFRLNPTPQTEPNARPPAAAAAENPSADHNTNNDQRKQEQRIASIRTKESRIDQLNGEIKDLEKAIPKEQFKPVSKAPGMTARLNAAKSELAKLRDEVARLRDAL